MKRAVVALPLLLGAAISPPVRAFPLEPACREAVDRASSASFWPKLEALCKNPAALEAARARLAPPDLPAYEELRAACAGDLSATPSFATLDDATRTAIVDRVATAAGVVGSFAAAVVVERAAPIVERLAESLGNEELLRTGAAADALVERLRGEFCSSREVAGWLPATCGGKVPSPALLELRKRLLRDLAALPARAVRAGASAAFAAGGPEARAAAAILATLASSAYPAELASLLAELSPARPPNAAPCVPHLPDARDPLGVAAHLLRRVTEDGERFVRGGRVYAEAALEAELRSLRLLAPSAKLSPQQAAAAEQLRVALEAFSVVYAAVRAGQMEASLERLAEGLLGTLEATLALTVASVAASGAAAPVLAIAPELRGAVVALGRGDALGAVPSVIGLARSFYPAGVSERVAAALRSGLRITGARDFDEASRIAGALALGLGPWADKVLFDANADLPRLESGDVKIIGDLLLGYQGRSFGVAARGAVNRWEFVSPTLFEDGLRAGGDLDTWAAVGLGRALKLDLRFSGQSYLYDSTVARVGSSASFFDENSILGRGLLSAGVRVERPRFAFGLWGSGGVQLELYDSVDVSGRTIGLNEEERVTAVFQGRFRGQAVVVPQWFTTRLRLDATRFDLTRNSLATTVGEEGIVPEALAEESSQTEVFARLFLDAEAARFAGFVPGLNAGFDYVARTSPTTNTSAFVPVFGLGVRRVAY